MVPISAGGEQALLRHAPGDRAQPVLGKQLARRKGRAAGKGRLSSIKDEPRFVRVRQRLTAEDRELLGPLVMAKTLSDDPADVLDGLNECARSKEMQDT